MPKREYPIKRCDVVDKESLRQFRKKRNQWRYWLDLDKNHAVRSQLIRMVTDHSVYRVLFRQTLEICEARSTGTAAANSYLFRFFEGSWLNLQAIHIRKLTESGEYEPGRRKKDKYQIISLRRVVEDMREHWHLFTRENFVAFDGAPFDAEKAEGLYFRKFKPDGEAHFVPTQGRKGWAWTRRRHETFDALSQHKFRQLSRTDKLPISLANHLLSLTSAKRFADVIQKANKIAAHAADVKSRQTAKSHLRTSTTFSRIEKIHQELCALANFLSVYFVSGTHNDTFFPQPQFDPIEHLRNPWVPEHLIPELRKCFRDFESKLKSYNHDSLGKVLGNRRK